MKTLRFLFLNTKDKIVDWHLTRKTGLNKEEREYKAWLEATVNRRAHTIECALSNFKYIIEVDWNRFFNHAEPFGWIPNQKAKEFLWPAKPIGECSVWFMERIVRDKWSGKRNVNCLGDEDIVVVATNNEHDAFMIAMFLT